MTQVRKIWLNKRSEVQSPPTPKTDWYLDLIIKNYYQLEKYG